MFQEDSHLELYRRSKKVFNSQQLAALKGIYGWRDKVARMEDESTGCVPEMYGNVEGKMVN